MTYCNKKRRFFAGRLIIWPLFLSIVAFPTIGNENKSEPKRIGQRTPHIKMNADSDKDSPGKFNKWANRERPRNTTVFYNPVIGASIIVGGTVLGALIGWPHDHGLLSENPELDEVFMGATLVGVMSIIPAIPFMKNPMAEMVDRKLENDPLWGPVIKENEERRKKCQDNFDG